MSVCQVADRHLKQRCRTETRNYPIKLRWISPYLVTFCTKGLANSQKLWISAYRVHPYARQWVFSVATKLQESSFFLTCKMKNEGVRGEALNNGNNTAMAEAWNNDTDLHRNLQRNEIHNLSCIMRHFLIINVHISFIPRRRETHRIS